MPHSWRLRSPERYPRRSPSFLEGSLSLSFGHGGAVGPFVGIYDAHDEVAAYDVIPFEAYERNAFDTGELSLGVLQSTRLSLGQIHLGGVSGYDHLRAETQAREEHLHLLRSSVLRLIQDHERIVQGTASHERQGCYLNYTPLKVRLELRRVDHLVESIVEGPEIRIDLRHHVSWQEA